MRRTGIGQNETKPAAPKSGAAPSADREVPESATGQRRPAAEETPRAASLEISPTFSLAFFKSVSR